MDILIIDQCSAAKTYPDECTVYDRSEIDSRSREELLDGSSSDGIPAVKLYDGRQQQFISDAVDRLRAGGNDVDRYFISAGFGLVEEMDLLPVYDVTFADMSASEIDERAEQLEISPAVKSILEESEYDVVFFALGSDYYRTLDLEAILSIVEAETSVLLFNQEALADSYENVLSVPARTDEAREYGTIVVALKGLYIQHFAANLGEVEGSASPDEVETACRTEPTKQQGLSDF